MASVETNMCMHSTYTHIYFKHICKQKKKCLFAAITAEMYLQAGVTPERDSEESEPD